MKGVFVKCFTKFLKVEHFTTFYKRFNGQKKIFYKFDHILYTNKYLKMIKYCTEDSLLQNKRSVLEVLFDFFYNWN